METNISITKTVLSSRSRGVSKGSMEPPFKDNRKIYLTWLSQTAHAWHTPEIVSTNYLHWQVDHSWADC